MEISYLGKSGFKIKAKTGSVRAEADQITMSHKGGGEDFVVTQAGEYEVEGVSVFGFGEEGVTVYVVQFEDIRVLYLGSLTKALSEKIFTELENIDVVIVPVDTLSHKEVIEIIAKIEPYYVLPYGETTTKFIASYEHGSRSVKSLNLSKISLPADLTEVIVFE